MLLLSGAMYLNFIYRIDETQLKIHRNEALWDPYSFCSCFHFSPVFHFLPMINIYDDGDSKKKHAGSKLPLHSDFSARSVLEVPTSKESNLNSLSQKQISPKSSINHLLCAGY